MLRDTPSYTASTKPRSARSTRPRSVEQWVRRKAQRQGLQLRRSRLRDPDAIGFGLYWLEKDGVPLFGEQKMTLEEIERYLTGGRYP